LKKKGNEKSESRHHEYYEHMQGYAMGFMSIKNPTRTPQGSLLRGESVPHLKSQNSSVKKGKRGVNVFDHF
jgi:hypothetical protein